MQLQTLPPPSAELKKKLKGTWLLISREDYTAEGEKKIDPGLGADPVGILNFTETHFAAQFMKRDRSGSQVAPVYTGKNNTAAVGGYDAYFGTYEVNEEKGQSNHHLIASINPSNVGINVVRDMRVNADDQLIIQLKTTSSDGIAITRTLTWKRLE